MPCGERRLSHVESKKTLLSQHGNNILKMHLHFKFLLIAFWRVLKRSACMHRVLSGDWVCLTIAQFYYDDSTDNDDDELEISSVGWSHDDDNVCRASMLPGTAWKVSRISFGHHHSLTRKKLKRSITLVFDTVLRSRFHHKNLFKTRQRWQSS